MSSRANASKTLGPNERGGGIVRGKVTDGAVEVTMSVNGVPGITAGCENVQLAATGDPPQARATDPSNPDSGFTTNAYVAVWPGEIVADGEELFDVASAKSCPVPLSVAVWGLFVALSVSVSVPVRLPVAVGVKVTLIVQLEPAATELPQVLVWVKSPEALMRSGVRAPLPGLFRVMD